MRWGGRFVNVGFASGEVPRLPLNLAMLKGVTIHGFDFGGWARHGREQLAVTRGELNRMFAEDLIHPGSTPSTRSTRWRRPWTWTAVPSARPFWRWAVEFEFDEDQRLLQRLVRETVAKSRSQPPDQLWATYLELGWLEAPPVELAIVLEELGYAADPTPSWPRPPGSLRSPGGCRAAREPECSTAPAGSSSTRTGRTRSPCSPATACGS